MEEEVEDEEGRGEEQERGGEVISPVQVSNTDEFVLRAAHCP